MMGSERRLSVEVNDIGQAALPHERRPEFPSRLQERVFRRFWEGDVAQDINIVQA